MTTEHTISRWAVPAAVETEGIGRRTTSHLNLTRSLADVWAEEAPRFRLVSEDGRYLNSWCDRLTDARANAWVGTKAQVTSMRGSLPLAKSLSPVEVVYE